MTILIRRRIVRNKRGSERDGRRLVLEREKEKFRGLSPRICVTEIKRDSITATQKRFNTSMPFLPTWFVSAFAIEYFTREKLTSPFATLSLICIAVTGEEW